MSALPPKADIAAPSSNVRFTPKSGHSPLFNYFVGLSRTPRHEQKLSRSTIKRLGCSSAQNTDERRDLLLCVSQDRPSRCRTADEREKFTPPHGPYPKAKDHGKYSRSGMFAVEKAPIHVRFGSLADIAISSHNVRFTPDCGHGSARF